MAVDSDLRSEVDSNVYLGGAGCCTLSAIAAGLANAAVDNGSRLVVLLVAVKIVVEVAAARSLRCMEVAHRFVLVGVVESSVNRRSNHSLPSLYVCFLYCQIR